MGRHSSCCDSRLEGVFYGRLQDHLAFRGCEFEGVSLRVIYLAERVHCQLVGEDALQVPMDSSEFMLAPLSMINAEYALWRPNMAYADWVREELEYTEFNCTCLMPSLLFEVCALSSHFFFHSYTLPFHS